MFISLKRIATDKKHYLNVANIVQYYSNGEGGSLVETVHGEPISVFESPDTISKLLRETQHFVRET